MKAIGWLATSVAGLAMISEAHAQVPAVEANTQTQAAGPQADASSGGVEEIVVTAQRRSEKLQNVPVAVTAASAAKLASVGITNTQDLGQITPGLSAPQASGFTQPHIRGVGSSTNGPGLEQPVATYIDGVYIAAATSSLLTLNNVDRIEVLKGPQGTLFGRNATGGLIQIVTKDPASHPEAAVNLSYANYKDVTADAYVTGPLAGNLRADLALRYETQQDGWGRNLGTGHVTGELPHDFAGRAKFLFEPGDATQVRLALDYEDRDSRRDTQKLDERQRPGTFDNPFFGGPFPQGGKYDINNNFDPENELKAGGASLQIKQDLGAVTLQSTTAYRRTKYHFTLDLDETPLSLTDLNGHPKDRQFSQEVQLSSNSAGRLTWTAGLFYYNANDQWDPINISFGASPISPVPGVPATVQTSDRMRTNSIAGYGQASYEFVTDTHLTLGGRYTYERKRLNGVSRFLINGFDAGDTAIPDPTLDIPGSVNFKRFNYRIALDHKFGPDILGYISYITGFKSGGYNLDVPSNAPYKPEDIQALEAGLKTELFDRHVRINTAGYYYIYKNIQVGRYIDTLELIYNGARARIYGVDLDAEFVVARGLTLDGGFAYNHARFTSFPNADYIVPACGLTPAPGGVVSCSADGNHLPFSPKITFNVGGTYKIELPIGSIEANASYFRTTQYFAAPDNIASQPAYDIVNVSLGWTDPAKHLSAKAWAKNLTNTYYSTSLIEAGQGVIRGNGAPRTYGVTLGYSF